MFKTTKVKAYHAYFVLLQYHRKFHDASLKKDKNIEETVSPKPSFPVVGIGTSAGGLEAISKSLTHLPSDLRMAYVIIQHLSPDRDSLLAELLEKEQ